MRIIEALLGEHGVIHSLLDTIERRQQDWSAEETRLAVVMLASALESHAVLEEELLFRELTPQLGLGHGPLGVMMGEHELIESNLARIALATADEIGPLVSQLVKLTREHFEKEEEVLFGLAVNHLEPDLLRQLGSRWAMSRRVDLRSLRQKAPERQKAPD